MCASHAKYCKASGTNIEYNNAEKFENSQCVITPKVIDSKDCADTEVWTKCSAFGTNIEYNNVDKFDDNKCVMTPLVTDSKDCEDTER